MDEKKIVNCAECGAPLTQAEIDWSAKEKLNKFSWMCQDCVRLKLGLG